MPKSPYNIAGTVPEEHGLATVADHLRSFPRDRVWAIVEFHASDRGTATPMEGVDTRHLTITLLSLEPITDQGDMDQLQAMRDRARLNRPGQGTMDEAKQQADLAAKREADQGGPQ